MRIFLSKNKILFLLIFTFLIFTLGNFQRPDPGKDLSVNVVFLFVVTFLIFTKDLLKHNIIFITQNSLVNSLFLLFALSVVIISWLRDGLLNTYLYSLVLTFTAVIVMIQFLYRLPFTKALNLFLLTLFIVMVLNLIVQYIKMGSLKLDISIQREQRLLGFLGGGLAGVLAGLSAIISIICYVFRKSKLPIFVLINIFLSWSILLMSDNRTAIIACAIVYIFIFFKISRVSKGNKLIFLIVIMAFYLFFRFYIQESIGGQRLSGDFDKRIKIWEYGMVQIKENPLMGYGKNNPFSGNYNALNDFGSNLADPHNAYLYLILRNGVVIAIFFFIFIISFVVTSYRDIRCTDYSLLILIPIYWLIVSITGGDYFNFKLNFGSLIFGISIFGFLNHPDLRIKETMDTITSS